MCFTGSGAGMRSRVEQSKGSGEFKELHRTVHWDPKKTAIIICDMWDDHTYRGAADRAAEEEISK